MFRRADEEEKHIRVSYHYDQKARVELCESQNYLWCYGFVLGLCSGSFNCIICLSLTLGFALLYACTSTLCLQHSTPLCFRHTQHSMYLMIHLLTPEMRMRYSPQAQCRVYLLLKSPTVDCCCVISVNTAEMDRPGDTPFL